MKRDSSAKRTNRWKQMQRKKSDICTWIVSDTKEKDGYYPTLNLYHALVSLLFAEYTRTSICFVLVTNCDHGCELNNTQPVRYKASNWVLFTIKHLLLPRKHSGKSWEMLRILLTRAGILFPCLDVSSPCSSIRWMVVVTRTPLFPSNLVVSFAGHTFMNLCLPHFLWTLYVPHKRKSLLRV